ncbi:MAG: DegT/DnrJ/EryC1/StrS family aminotransferase [Candidatus Latescibacterota bacterium]
MARTVDRRDLAINGGRPVHARPWRTGPFHLRDEIRALEALLSGPALPMARGPAVMAYRQQLQDCYGAKHAVPVSSGSAAIHVALHAAGVGAGDEVVVSPLTDYGSIIGVLQLNAIPVFADVAPDSLLMDVESIAARLCPHTRAVMPVHNGGYLVDMPALMKLARRQGVTVIEDCAQAHMAAIGRRFAGTFGHIGVWSTNESKHMKSGEGGFALTASRRRAEDMDLFADKCYPRFPGAPPTPAFPALNVRLNEVNATLAAVQLRHLPGWIARRQAFGRTFEEGIAGLAGVRPMRQPRGARPSYWWVTFVVDREVLGVDAPEFCRMLSAEGIPAGAPLQRYVLEWEVFRRLHEDPAAFRSYCPGRLARGAYPLDVAPHARASQQRIGGVRMTQHNTVAEARAAVRAVRKLVAALTGTRG